MKPETALIAPRQPFFYPDFSNDIHYEAEIVICINKVGKNIAEKFAYKYYDEITVGIDFTARDLQQKLKTKRLPWELAKAFDSSAPVGKYISKQSIDINALEFSLKVNGEVKQLGNTADMIFPVSRIISFVSSFITLKKGDLIFTGTPQGVGPVKKGDVLDAYIGSEKLLHVRVR